MTSKSPVRSAEDVDEQALSYAEIKALASGNPAIREKMDLDVSVAKLKLLKSSHLTQRYHLEDKIARQYPEAIRAKEHKVADITADWAHLKEVPPPPEGQISPLILADKVYTDKEQAGIALMAACKEFAGDSMATIGRYRGFVVETFVSAFGSEVMVSLRARERYVFALGNSPQGNVLRMDNALEGIQTELNTAQLELDNIRTQLENAKQEVERPFPQEAELTEKLTRLAELNAELNMDKRESEVLDGEPEAEPEQSPSRDLER